MKKYMTDKNLWGIAKTVITGKCIAIDIYFTEELSQISDLALYFKELTKSVTNEIQR